MRFDDVASHVYQALCGRDDACHSFQAKGVIENKQSTEFEMRWMTWRVLSIRPYLGGGGGRSHRQGEQQLVAALLHVALWFLYAGA